LSIEQNIACLISKLGFFIGARLCRTAGLMVLVVMVFDPRHASRLTITNENARRQPLLLPPKHGLSQHLLKTVN
jgi:hypothetical protein